MKVICANDSAEEFAEVVEFCEISEVFTVSVITRFLQLKSRRERTYAKVKLRTYPKAISSDAKRSLCVFTKVWLCICNIFDFSRSCKKRTL